MDVDIINEYIRGCKALINKISEDRCYDSETKNILTVILVGFLLSCPSQEQDIIMEFSTHIIMKSDEDMQTLYNSVQEKIFIETGKKIKDVNYTRDAAMAATMAYRYIDRDENGVEQIREQNTILLPECSSKSRLDIIHDLIHEIAHTINPTHFNMENNRRFITRGFSRDITYSSGEKTKENIIFEEVFNQLKTNEIVDLIVKMSELPLEDIEIREFLQKLGTTIHGVETYKTPRIILEPLLADKSLTNNIHSMRAKSDLTSLENLYNGLKEESQPDFESLSKFIDEYMKEYVKTRQRNPESDEYIASILQTFSKNYQKSIINK